ncbi:3-ketoacyl-CoA thiolase [Heyndrickxia coagulans]|uniref:3-ketoacyl-CoA thiolase n=1 Tax=Heyndrickxia coagulans TaxID=1398 RepID=A0A150K7A8_HEYCO|nr:3-ketoacyl-CoA thiolase [Heyndrickxia coagulans]
MTRAPFVMAKPENGYPRGNLEMFDTTIGWRFVNEKLKKMYGTDSMPETAENVAKQFHISREAQDAFAFTSQMRAKAAMEANRFQDEIVPVVYTDQKGESVSVIRDEHPRPDTTPEKLARLKPLFVGAKLPALLRTARLLPNY